MILKPKKLTLILCLLIFLPCITTGYVITTNVTDYSIVYNFIPNIDKQAEVYFDNELITFWVENELIMCGLEPSTCYRLTIQDLPDTVQHLQTITLPSEQPPFYAEYGIIGLFLLISLMLYLTTKIEYTGYIAIILSVIGFIYIIKQEPEFLTALLFAVLLFISLLLTGLKSKMET